jgi:thiamine biosynthesis lipoprotein ApbE
MPARPVQRLWIIARTATLAEIWSTSLMLIEPELIREFINGEPGIRGVYIDREDGVMGLMD